MTAQERAQLRAGYEHELFERVIPFWEHHAPDAVHGGMFNNLDRDGTVYDTTKHIWLLARAVWMFSKLYREVEPNPRWLGLAQSGVQFLREHARRDDGTVYFTLAADGKPIYRQRKIFTECFYALALSEYGRAADDRQLIREAEEQVERIWDWAYDWSKVGRPALAGSPPSQTLAVPMMLLNLFDEVMQDADCSAEMDDCFRRVRLHVHGEHVLENVKPDGTLLDGPAGRLLNPGHAIEAGWFLLHVAQALERKEVISIARHMVRTSHRAGWDHEHGGLFYFLDADGLSPVQLEWSMKLWWPHCEALYAHLLNHALSGSADDLAMFRQTHAYIWDHFLDPAHAEWYGYLDRQGQVTHRFKGGPYKGCFHVPRALWLCWRLLGNWPKA